MINYEVGGVLRLNEGVWDIIGVAYSNDKFLSLRATGRHTRYTCTFIPYELTEYTYTPPKKICEICDDKKYHFYIGPVFCMKCPSCVPKDEECGLQRFFDMARKLKIENEDLKKQLDECTNTKQDEQQTVKFNSSQATRDAILNPLNAVKPQPKFKVGDKVRILSGPRTCLYTGNISKIGTVARIDYNDMNCKINELSDNGLNGLWYTEDQLEKLIPITEKDLVKGAKFIFAKPDCEETGWKNGDIVEFQDLGYYLGHKKVDLICDLNITWVKKDFFFDNFMLVEPKEDPNVLISKEQRLKAGMEIFQEDAGNPRVFNDMLDAIRCSVNHFKAKPNDIEFTPIEALKEITINITKEQAKEMGLCKEKPKKTKEQIRDIVIEELKAKGSVFNGFYYVLKDKLVIDFSKDKMLLGYASIELFHGGWAYQIPYNENKSINKFLAKVEELLKPVYTPSKDDKPKFTKGEKIRRIMCDNLYPLTGEILAKVGNIYTFKCYLEQRELEIEEAPNKVHLVKYFEPVEYVDFSKAHEWLEEGYTVARLGWDAFLSVKFQLNNPIVVWYCNGKLKDNFSSEDVMANDWYWVKKPEGK